MTGQDLLTLSGKFLHRCKRHNHSSEGLRVLPSFLLSFLPSFLQRARLAGAEILWSWKPSRVQVEDQCLREVI